MCNCIEEVGQKVREQILKAKPEGAEVDESWGASGWDNQVMSLGDGKTRVMLNYKMGWYPRKKDGSRAKNANRKEVAVKMSHCPFCGEKFE